MKVTLRERSQKVERITGGPRCTRGASSVPRVARDSTSDELRPATVKQLPVREDITLAHRRAADRGALLALRRVVWAGRDAPGPHSQTASRLEQGRDHRRHAMPKHIHGRSRPEKLTKRRGVPMQQELIAQNWRAADSPAPPRGRRVDSHDECLRQASRASRSSVASASTLGNALRRVLISSLQGAAITNIRIANVLHEFSTIPGVMEDVSPDRS